MAPGLDINEGTFMSMDSKERDLTMFKNMVYIRKQFKNYKVNKKIQYVWLSILTTATLVLMGIKGIF